MIAQANRNGFYFLLDRTNGKNLTTKPFAESINWYKGVDAKGSLIPNPDKDPKLDGTLVSPTSTGITNWPAPAYSPDTGLLYVGTEQTFSLYYLTDTSARPQGYGSVEHRLMSAGNYIRALDYKTGELKWKIPTTTGSQGLLTTAGGLLFGTDGSGNFIAFDAENGKPLWHAGIGTASNAPSTSCSMGSSM